MKYTILLAVLLGLSLPVFAADPAPIQCVEEKIALQKLAQQNAQLVQQLMQAQFAASKQTEETAKAEQARLEGLMPKKAEKK